MTTIETYRNNTKGIKSFKKKVHKSKDFFLKKKNSLSNLQKIYMYKHQW